MKKLTRKQAEKILERRYKNIKTNNWVGSLCCHIDPLLRNDFESYWEEINTRKLDLMHHYFKDAHNYWAEVSFLRLLTAHIFIRETYE